MDIKSNYTTQRITLRISHNSLSMAAINRDSESQIDFEPYILKSGISMAANLREAFRESTLLSRGYTHATVLLDSPLILVPVEEFHEEDDRAEIHATIHVTRESQKGIIIGKGGVAIKKLGMVSRRDIEKFLGKKVDLRLFVKVTKDWRDKDATLKQFGYDVR